MTTPTTIRLDAKLKKRIARVAKALDRSAHALMVEGIERMVQDAEDDLEFDRETSRRSAEFDRTGRGIPYEDMKRWFADLARGHRRPVPRARRLR